MANGIQDFVQSFSDVVLDYALVLAAVATITVALLELAKVLLKARPRYHRRKVRAWIKDDIAFRELLVLATGGVDQEAALFDQPTDKMMGQIQAAANVALDFPDRYKALYTFLTTAPEEESSPQSGKTADQRVWLEFAARVEDVHRSEASSAQKSPSKEVEESLVRSATRARARLDHFVSRRLDAFQTSTEYAWARANQVIAVVGATAFLLWAQWSLKDVNPLRLVISSFFGGMVAPIAKDVVVALTGLRVKRT